MCNSNSGPSPAQLAIQQAQLALQQQTSANQLAEQQREFDIQQVQNQETLRNTKALQDKQQAASDLAAANTQTWETGRAAEQKQATDSIDQAFSKFTPAYYNHYIGDYTAHYQPQINQQYGAATNNTTFGLARTGNLQSQTAADQFQQLQTEKGQAIVDVNNQAMASATNLKNNILNAKQNLMSQATSDATLGSPITPGSADAITAEFNNTSANLGRIANTAGDTVTTLQATPQYASLGSLFGGAASSAGAAISGNNAYNNYQAFNTAFGNSGAAGAANPASNSSSRVS